MSETLISEFVAENQDLKTAIYLLDQWVAHQVHRRHQPGLSIGLVHNGDLIWGRGYGYADLEAQTPVTLDTRFRIASITKSFVATAIMQLYDAGKLRLDDPVSQYLGWFDLRYPDAPPITIYHLLTHTSGLPRDSVNPAWTEADFPEWDQFVEDTKKREPVMPPLQDYKYSNLGYSLLGGVIRSVTGQSWEDYVQANILDPLGMSETRVHPDPDDPQLATGYRMMDDQYQRASAPYYSTRGFGSSANMVSSVRDLAKYARFHLSKGQTPLLSGYSLREMHRPHWVHADWSGGYGLGLFNMRVDGYTVTGHSGGYTGYLTMFTVARKHDFGAIVLTNALGSDPYSYIERVYKLVLPEIEKITAESAQPDPAWERFTGVYTSEWSDSHVVVRDGQLQVIDLDYIDAPPTVLKPTDDPNVFTIHVQGNPGQTARFETDEEGKVTRLWFRNEYVKPKNHAEN